MLASETVGFIGATAIAFAIIVIKNKAMPLNGRANNDFLFNCLCFDFATMRISVPTNHAKQTFFIDQKSLIVPQPSIKHQKQSRHCNSGHFAQRTKTLPEPRLRMGKNEVLCFVKAVKTGSGAKANTRL